jgi:hypothetical protein
MAPDDSENTALARRKYFAFCPAQAADDALAVKNSNALCPNMRWRNKTPAAGHFGRRGNWRRR